MDPSFAGPERPVFIECDEIEPGLYLGNLDAAEDEKTCRAYNITHVLTVYSYPFTKPANLDIQNLFVDVEDRAEENILSSFDKTNTFIKDGQEKGACMVHCYGGISRSATLVIAYLMNKYHISYQEAMNRVKKKRYCICPNQGFVAQLQLYETMECKLDESNIRYKIFLLQHIGQKVLNENNFCDVLSYVVEAKPEKQLAENFKCKRCRQDLFHECNVIPHIQGKNLEWQDTELHHGLELPLSCNNTLFVEFLSWMTAACSELNGKILCPKCQCKIGSFSWTGQPCHCGALIAPNFKITESKVDRVKAVCSEN